MIYCWMFSRVTDYRLPIQNCGIFCISTFDSRKIYWTLKLRSFSFLQAQPKHLSCIAVSAFHLSCQFTPGYNHLRDIPQVVPDSRDLTTISQCKCSSGDVTRMERIIMDKLATDLRCQPPVTPLTLLRILYAAHNHLAAPLVHLPTSPPPLTTLIHKLEIVECDSAAATFRPSELALSLLALEFTQESVNKNVHHACISHLQNICKVRHHYMYNSACQTEVALCSSNNWVFSVWS